MPSNETARLSALYQYQILGTPPEEGLDDLSRLAGYICQVPIALIGFIDRDRQWFKSKIGFDLSEIPRESAFCSYTILQPDLFMVRDALADERFAACPMVTVHPYLRFYAGVPLVTPEGFKIGTLSVFDYVPRQLNYPQMKALRTLAREVMTHLEMNRKAPLPEEEGGHIRKLEEALYRSEERNRALLDLIPGWMFRINRAGMFLDMTSTKETALSPQRYLGKQLSEVLPAEVAQRAVDHMEQAFETGTTQSFEYQLITEGTLRDYQTKIVPQGGDEVWAVIFDITEQKLKASLTEYRALHDPLTHLPNRVLFYDRLRQAVLMGEREGIPFALLMLGLDHFKEINHTLGRQFGDLILQQVAQRLQKMLRATNTVARLGGDEFGILLQNTDLKGANAVAEKFIAVLDAPFFLEGKTVQIEASIGIALYPNHGGEPDILIRRTNLAMYRAKHSEDRYVSYVPGQDRLNPDRLALMSDLRRTIERNDQLLLLYQPKIDLRAHRIAGVEALLRWQHPEQGLILPDQFVHLAEQTWLIKSLTLWVLASALRQCRVWHHRGLEISVAVNLSARNLQDSKFPEEVGRLLAIWGISPQWLELEITESSLMSEPARTMEILNHLSRMGVRLSIDDFGTGYSSLGYLTRLPVDTIKIDKTFVAGMLANSDDAVIVRSTIDLGHNLGLQVIAEGIENRETSEKVTGLGCDMAQGHYISPPIPPADLVRWLQGSPWALKEI